MSNVYVFPGHKSFSARAVSDLGLNAQTMKGKTPSALAALARLCAQASTAPPANVAGILLKAAAFRDQLLAAGHAADLMIAEVTLARPPIHP